MWTYIFCQMGVMAIFYRIFIVLGACCDYSAWPKISPMSSSAESVVFSVQCLLYSRHWNLTCLRFSMACVACGRESWPCFIEYKNWRMVDSGCFPQVCICLRLILGRLPSRIFNEGVAACVACGRESWPCFIEYKNWRMVGSGSISQSQGHPTYISWSVLRLRCCR